MSLKLIITKGIPASGKTTWARKWVNEDSDNRVRVSRDDIRNMLGPYWIRSREGLVSKIEREMVTRALTEGYSVVVDKMNLRSNGDEFRHIVNKNFKDNSIDIEEKDFTDVSLAECLRRDKEREDSVGADIVIDKYKKYIKND